MEIRKFINRLWLMLSLGIAMFLNSCSEGEEVEAPPVKYKLGDNQAWSGVGFNDEDWLSHIEKSSNDIFWVRTNFSFGQDWDKSEDLGLFIAAFGAYEVYWDGILLGSNGEVGDETDRIGEYHRFFIVPDSLSRKGPHTLSLRASQKYYSNQETLQDFIIYNYFDLVRRPLINTLYINILAGAFVITAIYFFILYFNDRKSFPVLLFSISSFLFFLLIILEYMKFYTPIHYSHFYIRLELIGILTFLISFLIPYYFSIQFLPFWRKYVVSAYLLVLLIIFFVGRAHGDFQDTAMYHTISMWGFSVLIVGYSALKKVKGSIVVFVGLLVNVFAYYLMVNYDQSLALSFVILLLCMSCILGVRVKEQREAHEYSLVQTTRLKNELLKKKIQPHFLMNTLTSLIDWVEESPVKGIEFIEALALEFDMLNQIEDKQLIPISQEIELCKSHIRIMVYRKQIEYVWQDFNIDFNQKIPPALIHTLVENGITHSFPLNDGTITFRLVYETNSRSNIYKFLVYSMNRNPDEKALEGTGIKYIKARLVESYGAQWSFESKAVENGWESIITIYTK